MKKAAITIGLCVLTAGLASGAQTLRLIAPNGGEAWTLGQKYQIQWTASGIAQQIKLVLVRSGAGQVGVIAKRLDAGSSPFTWTAGMLEGGMAPAGVDYKIRIRTLDNELGDASDHTFSLSSPGGGGKPDFEVSHMGCTPRVNNGAVQRVDVQLYIKNSGTDYQGPLAVHYICLDSLVNPKISLDEVVSLPSVSIPHGQWYGFTLCQPTIPTGVKSINLGIQVDPNNLVQETSETNNHFNYSYTIPPLDEIDPR